MRQYGPTSPRNIPTDRNPVTIALGGTQPLAGGAGAATFVTYTVPAGRRAILWAQANMIVTVAFAAAQTCNTEVDVTPNGGALAPVAQCRFETLEPLSSKNQSPSVTLQLKAGDLVVIKVTIGAGAGAVNATGGLQGVEYDA